VPIQELSKLFGYPQLSQKLVKLRTSNLAGTFTGPSEQKHVKNFGKRERISVCRDYQIFLGATAPIISGTGKATNVKFCTHIHS